MSEVDGDRKGKVAKVPQHKHGLFSVCKQLVKSYLNFILPSARTIQVATAARYDKKCKARQPKVGRGVDYK